jgi:hypothetical protein
MEVAIMENGNHSAAVPSAAVSESGQYETSIAHWRELATRRLSLLVAAEHDVSVLREHLDLLQSEQQVLLRERGEQLLRIRRLESELAMVLASRSWRLTAPLRDSSHRWRHLKVKVRAVLRWFVMRPVMRPAIRLIARMLPGLSLRLRARLHVQ